MQNRVERQIRRDESAMLKPRLSGKKPVPRIAIFPIKICCKFGMQIGDG